MDTASEILTRSEHDMVGRVDDTTGSIKKQGNVIGQQETKKKDDEDRGTSRGQRRDSGGNDEEHEGGKNPHERTTTENALTERRLTNKGTPGIHR